MKEIVYCSEDTKVLMANTIEHIMFVCNFASNEASILS